jgi:hypothetical protein
MRTNAVINGIAANTPYKSIPGDVEFTVGRQLAAARSLEMTVREFSNIRQTLVGDGNAFIDYRKFTSKPRSDMPAALYIRTLLFRAFRLPSNFTLKTARGFSVPLDSLEIVNEMIAQVTHDPVTGNMFWDTTLPSDGPGYAIVQGYQVGQDGFRTINPARFNFSEWTSFQNIWQHIPFQVDDSGDIDKFIIFDEPVINSSDLFYAGTVDMNGYAGLRSNPTFNIPSVKCALTFRAERFEALFGEGTRDQTMTNSELHEEYLGTGLGWVINPYSDGYTAYQKAQTLADPLLELEWIYIEGGYERPLQPLDNIGTFATGTRLTGMIDRVSVRGGAQGMIEQIDYQSERKPREFIADRDFDRRERDRGLFPGQKELIERSNQLKMIAAALRARPDIMRSMAEALHGRLKDVVVDKTKIPVGGINVYSPVRKKPTVYTSGSKPTNTTVAVTADSTHNIFAGVCVTHLESGGAIRVKETGDVPVRVKGPVNVGDPLSLTSSPTGDYLVKGSTAFAGTALQAHTGTDVKVIMSRLGSGSSEQSPIWV